MTFCAMAQKPWRKAGDEKCSPALSYEGPLESALADASEKLLRSAGNLFARGRTALLSSDIPREARRVSFGVEGSQRPCLFATTGFAFTPTTGNLRHDDDAKEYAYTDASESCNKQPSVSSVILRGNSRQERKFSREEQQLVEHTDMKPDLQINQDRKSVRKVQKVFMEPVCRCSTASLSLASINKYHHEECITQEINHPSAQQLFSHPLALLSYIPKDISLFLAGAIAGATAKTVTAPLDRIKLLMQVYRLKATREITKRSIGFLEAAVKIGEEEGMRGFWKGNLPQVIRVIPYSAVQLLSYELYKKLFKGKNNELSVAGRLAAGACAGMTSTLVTYPLDVLRLRLAVDPASKTMIQVASAMLREEGLPSFYRGLGPSLLGIAPYIALNFCAFDLIKLSLPEEMKKTPTASFLTAFLSASLATTMCYPLDTVRRQLQMKGAPYFTVFDAIPGIIASDGVLGLYRGFVPNALKNLPNSSIRLTTFDAAKNLIHASQQEYQRLINIRRGVASVAVDLSSVKRS